MSKLRSIDVSGKTEKKGKFTYLSWAFAVDQLIENYPEASWEVKRFPMIVSNDGVVSAIPEMLVPYMKTGAGNFVEVEVVIDGVSRSQVHPVLNHQNKPIDKPNAFDINTAIQRCLAKAIALHGLGLYIYAGEDLPPDAQKEQVSTDVIDGKKVENYIKVFKGLIDQDQIEETHERAKTGWKQLTNDERIAVTDRMQEKAPDSNKAYKNLLKEHINYKEAR